MDLGLAGRAAVVTGSSQGIGRATALLFGSEGARVAVTYHHERDKALAVVDEIENGGGEAVATEFDLASTSSVSRAVGTALERWGQVDKQRRLLGRPRALGGALVRGSGGGGMEGVLPPQLRRRL